MPEEERKVSPAVVLIPIGLGLGLGLIGVLAAMAWAAPPKVYTCPHCGATFDTEEELLAHIELEHPEVPPVIYTCPYCGAEFATEEELDAHIQTEHAMIILEPNGDGDIIELGASGLPHWQMVLHEDTIFYPPDDVYIFGHFEGNYIAKHWWPSEWQTDLFTFTNVPSGMPAIAGLTIKALFGDNAYSAGNGYITLKTHGTIYYSERSGFPYGSGWLSHSWEKNPYTNLPWTKDEVNALQAGVTMIAGVSPGGGCICDQLKIEIQPP